MTANQLIEELQKLSEKDRKREVVGVSTDFLIFHIDIVKVEEFDGEKVVKLI